jgi:hypothetical protein
MRNKTTNCLLEERANSAKGAASATSLHEHKAPAPPHRSKLERTQSLLTVISTSIGLMGVAGSIVAFGISNFYTGAVEVRPPADTPDLIVKVYGKDGHESVFHTRHIDLVPGNYHLEVSSGDGGVAHADATVRFHKTSTVPVVFRRPQRQSLASSTLSGAANVARAAGTEIASLAGSIFSSPAKSPKEPAAEESTPQEPEAALQPADNQTTDNAESGKAKKKRWWQIWKRSANDGGESDSSLADSKTQ